MRIAHAIALGAALLLSGTACHDFLTGPSLGINDPNGHATLKDPGPLYVGLEAGQAENNTAQLARFVAEYMQQISGVARQQQGFDQYIVGPGDDDGSFASVWAALPPAGGGGAADARKIQTIALAQHDSIYVGIAKVWEAMIIGDAASIWGDIPYSQAFDVNKYPQPKYDPQLSVFAAVETTLDQALAYLNCDTTGKTNLGPTGVLPGGVARANEIIYAGRTPGGLVTVYKAVAHTLKARYYMNMAAVDASNYAKALAQAQLGIATPNDDWTWFADVATGANQWVSFQGARGGDISGGAALVNLMRARVKAGLDIDNGRIGFYYIEPGSGDPCTIGVGAADNGCTGARPGGNSVLPGGGGNIDFNIFNNGSNFRQPQVTFTENALIIAEAALQTGNAGLAGTALNAVRDSETYGADPVAEALGSSANPGLYAGTCSPTCKFPAQPHVPATLRNIIEEKYIDLFATPEVWNDYKRTCLPYLAAAPPTPTSSTTRANLPGRLPYGLTASNADPNTPNVGATSQNANDPHPCPTLTYTSTPAAW